MSHDVVDIVLSPQFFSDFTIFALTSKGENFTSTNAGSDGIYYSTNFGDFGTFSPLFPQSSPLSISNISVLRLHNRYDVGSISGENLMKVFMQHILQIMNNGYIIQFQVVCFFMILE